MKLTLEVDYAIRIVHVLSLAKEKTSTSYLSETCEIPLRFASKILLSLVDAGIVSSTRGVKGGYMLAKQPAEITFLDVIESVDGPLEIHRCNSGGHVCTDSKVKENCRIKASMEGINEEVKRMFQEVTFLRFI